MKNIRNFVLFSSLVLSGWLGLTFVNKVPTNRYPTLGNTETAALRKANSKSASAQTAGAADLPKEDLTAIVVPAISSKKATR